MDHAVKAMSARGPLSRLVARRRFESAELEELYARYACKLQRTSVGSALALWALLAAALAAVDATRGWRRAPQVGVLTAHALLCSGLAWWCGRAGVAPERRLPRACWLALAGGGVALAATLPAWNTGAAAEGAAHVVWAVFAAYALLPVGAPVAAAFGILLPTAHTIASALMVGNVVVFVCVNVVGALMHSLMETAQRRAFLDTRNCIAARLDMEDENEKLERLLLSVLPQHVAMEMKNDIISPVEGQFHKIYIQKHEQWTTIPDSMLPLRNLKKNPEIWSSNTLLDPRIEPETTCPAVAVTTTRTTRQSQEAEAESKYLLDRIRQTLSDRHTKIDVHNKKQ
ncbi:hypothetical protein SFRURICE_015433 [Spodoptera frugiperda]|nr:hypothetical protein SFRURICE_015433 [Spodoptera frugiperda]